VTLTAIFPTAAAIDGVLGLIAAILVFRTARDVGITIRTAHLLCALGFLTGSAGFLASGAWTAATGITGWALTPLIGGLSLQGIAVLAGALRCGGASEPRGTALRRGVEGLVLASCGAYAVWSFAIESTSMSYLGAPLTMAHKSIGLLLLAPTALVLSICATVSWRTRRRGPGPLVVVIAFMAAAGASLFIAAGYHSVAAIVVTAAGYGAGIGVAAVYVRRGVHVADEPLDRVRGTLLAWVPVAVAIIACITHLAIYHSADNTSILIATVIGAALGGRQTLAMHDVRAYAEELARREARFRELAHTDPLTNLGNRRAFVQTLQEQVVGGPPSVLLSIDLDGFKNINDLRGHDVGDAVLIEVARRLRANLRPHDIAARLGGDEFAVVLWLRQDEAVAAASRLRTVLAAPYDVNGSSLFLSASIGTAPCDGATDVAGLIRNADLALRFAKLRGKNRVEGYAEAYAQWLRRRMTIETELRGAIARDEISVLYQPVLDLRTGLTVGVEAVLRWHHPSLGQIMPDEFIPIAEDSNLIDEIGRWVMGEACRQLARWIVDGYHLWLGVNISVRELHRPDYVSQVTDFIRAHRLPTDRLVLEVTEHSIAVDLDELVAVLDALRDAGVRIALDDFGAGYSSLASLDRLPVDILKVNTAVIATAVGAPADDATAGPLADVVVRLGQCLGVDVVAAGVVRSGQRAVVETAGYRLVQGDLFARAMPAEHLEARLATELIPVQRPAS
jgi:diguanylate cyclase (GGDEF)-like protein